MSQPKLLLGFQAPSMAHPRTRFVPLVGPKSLQISNDNDFRVKLRQLLDRLENYKYIDSVEFYRAPTLTAAQEEFLNRLDPIRIEVLQELKSSLGSFQDSLIGLENFFENISVILRYPDISQLKVKGEFSACVISAGPSFELEIENLRNFSSQFLLIAVDAVLPRLVKEKIFPDLVVSTERLKDSRPFFENLPSDIGTVLLGQPTIPKDFFDLYPGPKASVNKFSGPFLWLPFERAQFWTGSSSAHLAYSCACYLGAKSVALIGQDLAFHPESFQSHSQLEVYPEWAEAKSKEELIASQGAYEVPGNTRERVLTIPIWETFAHEFSLLGDRWKVPTINTSILGRRLAAFPFEDFNSWASRQNSSFEKDFPKFNREEESNLNAYTRQAELAIRSLGDLKERIRLATNQDQQESVYQSLSKAPHFLELVFELVIRDFASTESQVFQHPEKAAELKRQFLNRASTSIDPVLQMLKKSLQN